MTRLRRFNPDGHPCFITNVTYKRKPILVDNADLLQTAFSTIQQRASFELLSWVFMPDHFHLILNLENDSLSSVMQGIKMSFGSLLRKRLGVNSGRVWQNGFWDHIIRDEIDMNRHMDYIHFNPVKHGYVNSPFKWPYSSINNFIDCYPPDWGVIDKPNLAGDYGE